MRGAAITAVGALCALWLIIGLLIISIAADLLQQNRDYGVVAILVAISIGGILFSFWLLNRTLVTKDDAFNGQLGCIVFLATIVIAIVFMGALFAA